MVPYNREVETDDQSNFDEESLSVFSGGHPKAGRKDLDALNELCERHPPIATFRQRTSDMYGSRRHRLARNSIPLLSDCDL